MKENVKLFNEAFVPSYNLQKRGNLQMKSRSTQSIKETKNRKPKRQRSFRR